MKSEPAVGTWDGVRNNSTPVMWKFSQVIGGFGRLTWKGCLACMLPVTRVLWHG